MNLVLPIKLILFTLIISSKTCFAADYQYENCVPTNCGSGPNISFPFYVPNIQESYCGYSRFEITCKNGSPILQLSENDENEYVVEEIFYQNRTVRVFNALASSDGNTNCPPRIRNTTLPAGRFAYVSATTTSLHLLSDCRSNVSEELSRYEVRCGSSREGSNGTLGMYGSDGNLGKALENCEENIVAPVEILGDERENGGVDVAEVLRRGFAMNWVASDCSVCRESGGRCGFNESSFHFRCFCPDGPHSRSCRRPGSFLLFLFSFHLLPLSANSDCQPSYPCGDFSLEFPFTVTSNPGCGLITVDGCDSEGPKIISGHEFTILKKIDPNKFLVQDNSLDGFLNNRSCLFVRNLTVPQIYPLSFTYFTCFNKSFNGRIHDYFANYSSINSSNGIIDCQSDFSTIYYRNPTAGTEESDIPTECSTIQLPVIPDADSDDLLPLLTSNFTLEWNVPEGCSRSKSGNEYDCNEDGGRWKVIIAICIPIAAVLLLLVAFFILWQRKKRLGGAYLLSRNFSSDPSKSNIWGKHAEAKDGYEKDVELFLKNNGNLAPIRYKYSTIKKITNSFSEKLGRGGFGSVYKGQLPDGHPVAVKVLHESDGNGEDFMNEVASISRTSHINIVSLLGFCFEGSKRALIFDFMPNGSLEKFIGNTVESGLGWDKLFEIALRIARGLEYLHQGCNTRILHLDIKPQNILLDKDLNPRIADFGLAKLCPNRSSIVSMMVARGTIGYIAPEVFSRNFGEVSYKSDVYSYGMLVLEMVGGRRTVDRTEVDRTSEIYFPHYIYKDLEKDAYRDGDFVGRMSDGESQIVKRNLMIVGLWCVQTNPKDRPSMTKVVEMLEGKLGTLEVPPKPYLYSPPRSAPTFSNSESL